MNEDYYRALEFFFTMFERWQWAKNDCPTSGVACKACQSVWADVMIAREKVLQERKVNEVRK